MDNVIIHLRRNNILRRTSCPENNLILVPYHTSELYIRDTQKSDFVPPEAFLLDRKGLLQNENHVPIVYHKP